MRFPLFLTLLGASLMSVAAEDQPGPVYPATRRVDQVDDYHGQKVADPYRWLEDDVRHSADVAAWVAAQNKVTQKHLSRIGARAGIRARLEELWNYERQGVPIEAAGRLIFSHNDGLQNQPVLKAKEPGREAARVLLDPNSWSKEGTKALAGWVASPDGRSLAYGTSEAGSDWSIWRVLDIESGEPRTDVLRWIKWGGIAWTPDNKGFFYSRLAEPEEGEAHQSLNLDQKLYYHRLGSPQSADVLVHEDPAHPKWGFSPRVSDDGRFLIITVWQGTDDRYQVLCRDLTEPYGMTETLIAGFDHEYSFIGNDGDLLYFQTNRAADRGRIIAIDRRSPSHDSWQELVAEQPENLRHVSLVGNLFVLNYLKDARSVVRVHRRDGRLLREIALPGLGSAGGFSGRRSSTSTHYSYSSYDVPPSVYRYDMHTGESELVHRSKVDFDPSRYSVEQVFYESKDGARVPMFLARRKDLERNGKQPTLLYGYGGFNIPLTPGFSVSWLSWMEMGGVLAVANLRGGGEYGEAWHKAGTKHNKQNVFDDFIAAARWLISQRWTCSARLAIQGRSNGGLLVGAALTQQPELFGACLPAVGVMDMLRFHRFTAGRFWVDDYGCSDDPADFAALYAYSPLHRIREGARYPATLISTADTDDRVVPGHSFKFAATLQRAQAGPAPVLIRIETRGGHGAGLPTAKLIDAVADEWAFLVDALDMPRDPGSETAPAPKGEK